MFGFKKKKNNDAVVDTGKTETCPVKFVRRVDEQRTTKDSGDGEWRYSDTRDT